MPAIRALREKYPDARISLVLVRECVELLPAIPGIDRAFIVRRGLRDVATFAVLAREKFDCCIDFTENDRSALLTFLSGAKRRLVSKRVRNNAKKRVRIYNEFVDVRLIEMHTLDYNLGMLAPLGIDQTAPKLQLNLPPSAHDRARLLLQTNKIDNGFVVFHPGSARAEKFWEAERWADLIERAREKWHVAAVITGAKWRFEQEHIESIKSRLPEGIVDLSGQTDLLTLTALIARARLLVTVDSAAMHLAATQGTPQVALFGPTNPFHWRPRQGRALILHGASPFPVSDFAPKRERLPMKQISTEAVFSAMDSLLSAPAAQVS